MMKNSVPGWCLCLFLAAAGLFSAPVAMAERIRDLATVQGVRSNALIGYGLVVGLDGTGDQTMQTPFTTQSLNNMLSQLGITVPAGTNMQLKNVAAVDGDRTASPVLPAPGRRWMWWSPRWATPRACAAARC
jgi:flagellar P-ring protein precursor FlgI